MSDWEDLPPQFQALVVATARRLAPICQHLPAAEFSAMVQRIAEVEFASKGPGGWNEPPPPTSESARADHLRVHAVGRDRARGARFGAPATRAR